MAALKPRKFNIEDSNIIQIGIEFEKKLKMVDQEKDTRWKNAGKKAGLQIWRVEKYKVIPWAEDHYGHFYTNDCYILLKSTASAKDPKKLSHDTHFWVGKNTSQDEYATAAYFTLELDEHLVGDVIQHREIQGAESALFLSYFKTIVFHEAGIDTLYHKVQPKDYKPRLLHLRGTKNVIMREVPMNINSLNSGDVFILDNGLDIYTMNGNESGGMERAKAAELSRAMVQERGNAPILHVFKEDDEKDEGAKAFWELLGGRGPIAPASPDAASPDPKRLFRLSDETGRMLFKEVKPFTKESLDTNDTFILDSGDHIFVWVGKKTSDEERKQALPYAVDYMFRTGRPKSIPVTRFSEGSESDNFWAGFA